MGVQLSRYLARPSQPIRVEWAFGNITVSLRYYRHLDVNIRFSTAPTLELEGEDREDAVQEDRQQAEGQGGGGEGEGVQAGEDGYVQEMEEEGGKKEKKEEKAD